MAQANFQTIRLGKGKHWSPEEGACVMELASMLAGEPFSDHPRSVSRAIAAFMRAYNDALDDDRRQTLYAYASASVGTAGSIALEQERARILVEFADVQWERRASRSLLERLRHRRARRQRSHDLPAAARYAVRAIGEHTDASHREAVALIDRLIATTDAPAVPCPVAGGAGEPVPERAAHPEIVG